MAGPDVGEHLIDSQYLGIDSLLIWRDKYETAWWAREDYPASMIAMVYQKVGHLIIPRDHYVYYRECPTISPSKDAFPTQPSHQRSQ
jgi:hypothetical protein